MFLKILNSYLLLHNIHKFCWYTPQCRWRPCTKDTRGICEVNIGENDNVPSHHLSRSFRVDFSKTATFNHVFCFLNSGSKITTWWFSHNHLANFRWHSSPQDYESSCGSGALGLLMVRSRPNGPRSGLWTESVRSQVSKTMWTVWTVEFFYHKSICFLLKILFYYHNSIQIINKNAKFIHCLYEFLFFLKSNFLNK